MSTDLTPIEPWAQRRDEHDRDYAHFVRFAELPKESRTLAMTAKRQGVPIAVVRKAAEQHHWETRVAAFDQTVIEVTSAIEIDDTEALTMQYAVGMAMMRLGVESIKLKNPGMLRVKDIQALLTQGAEMARRGAGVADLTVEQRQVGDRIEDQFRDLLGE